MFDKKNSDIIADIKATPEQKEKKIIRKMKINKKVVSSDKIHDSWNIDRPQKVLEVGESSNRN